MALYYYDPDYTLNDVDEAPQALYLMRLLMRHDPAALLATLDDPTDMIGLQAIIQHSPSLLTVYLGKKVICCLGSKILKFPQIQITSLLSCILAKEEYGCLMRTIA